MMRKLLFLLMLLGLFTTQSKAQFPVTFVNVANNGIPQAMSPLNNVTVTRWNPPVPWNAQTVCGVGPYLAGGLKSDGFDFGFSRGATRIQIDMADIHDNDTVEIKVNGVTHILTTAELTNSALCPNLNTTQITPAGHLTSVGTPFGPGTAVQININQFPTMITSFSVRHLRQNPNSGGVVFGAKYWEDTCDAGLLKVTDDDPCTGRDLHLTATAFPNATFNWSDINGWTATGANPVRPNINILQGGTYTVTITKGACPPIVGSTFVLLKTGPNKPTVSLNTSPVCKGGTVDLDGYTSGITGVQYFWYGPSGFFSNSQKVTMTNMQLNQVGLYSLYAISTDGCVSDTTDTLVYLLPDVTANFSHIVLPGCDADTVIFTNTTTGATGGIQWFVNKIDPSGNPIPNLVSQSTDPTITYIIPFDKSDVTGAPQNYDLKALGFNGGCYDSNIVRIQINHPLVSEFTVDDDTICQNATTINFSNKSSTAVIGTHEYLWDFKDGSPTETTYNVSHLYSLAGVYDASLIITDQYKKCKDTFIHKIFVDSTGAITYTASDTVICPGDVVSFKGNYSEIGNIGTQWSFSDGNIHKSVSSTVYAFERAGTFPVKFTAFNRVCPDTSATKDIVVKPQPVIDLGPDTAICPNGAPVVLRDTRNLANPNAKWLWNNNTHSTDNNIIVRHPGVYAATVEIEGCKTTDSVVVAKNCYINLPNVFLPGSADNGYFLPRQLLSRGVSKFAMVIFDRWGKKVFETTNVNGRGWDGTFNGEPQPQGVYVYTIEATFVNNTTEHYQGNVTMLR